MAAANDSQGLKIAVAAFVTLTVVLAVTTYFGFSNYSEADQKLTDAQNKLAQEKKTADGAVRDYNELKRDYGYEKIEDFAAVKDAMKKDAAKLQEQLTALNTKVGEAIAQYKQAGGNQQKVDELLQAFGQVVGQVTSEPNRTAQSTISRVTELLENLSLLTTELTLDNESLRRDLLSANTTNEKKLDVQTTAAQKSAEDREAEAKKHEQERQNIMTKHDQLATANNSQATEINKLKQQITQMQEDHGKKEADLLSQVKYYREQTEKKEVVLDKADGRVTFVDYARGEVRTNITRRMGAKPQMQMAIFDRNAPGLPTDAPKATIELIQVGDQGSVAKIVKTIKSYEPIRLNDQVYSAAWSPGSPQRFALIGKIDIDRDGRDDREDLKRMIRAAGGIIDYDLPPAGIGRETGEMTPRTSWYVLDERDAIHPATAKQARVSGADDPGFLEKKTAAIRLARLEGIRPMSIERILAYLGYSFGQAMPGRAEVTNRDAADQLLNPKGKAATATAPTSTEGAEAKSADEATPPEEMKDEKKDDKEEKDEKKDEEPK